MPSSRVRLQPDCVALDSFLASYLIAFVSSYSPNKVAQRFLKHLSFSSPAVDQDKGDQERRQQANQIREAADRTKDPPSFPDRTHVTKVM